MTLSQLRAFALVARMGSMRAAAAALGISEPAVSSAVAALRNDLGDALVVRSGGGIAPTPRGGGAGRPPRGAGGAGRPPPPRAPRRRHRRRRPAGRR
ncbi:MAG: LysR family transcriptional regulator, partial [Cellulomonas sp.]|nr:LysR family transcriptional regulator [Cellulomonas sp.]